MFGLGILKGLGVTFRELFKPKFTVRYPEERLPLPPGYRGAPLLVLDRDTNKARCVGCGACVRACPQGVIKLATERTEDGSRKVLSYEIEIARCLFCGFCVDACPFGALQMSQWFELPAYTRTSLAYSDRFWVEPQADDVFVSETEKYVSKLSNKKSKARAK
jgi:NADH-quinone oxidoreductase subunit I